MTPRIPADQRREQILAVASELFGERGYAGTTTDQVAKAAGISQPYVVRMFGTKEQLFLEALERARDALMVTFRRVLAEPGDGRSLEVRLGSEYIDLVADRGILRILMHAFLSGSDPVVGPAARTGFLDIFRFLTDEAGFTTEQCVEFLSRGMLYNTILALELPSLVGGEGADSAESLDLLTCTFGSKLDRVLDAAARG